MIVSKSMAMYREGGGCAPQTGIRSSADLLVGGGEDGGEGGEEGEGG